MHVTTVDGKIYLFQSFIGENIYSIMLNCVFQWIDKYLFTKFWRNPFTLLKTTSIQVLSNAIKPSKSIAFSHKALATLCTDTNNYQNALIIFFYHLQIKIQLGSRPNKWWQFISSHISTNNDNLFLPIFHYGLVSIGLGLPCFTY